MRAVSGNKSSAEKFERFHPSCDVPLEMLEAPCHPLYTPCSPLAIRNPDHEDEHLTETAPHNSELQCLLRVGAIPSFDCAQTSRQGTLPFPHPDDFVVNHADGPSDGSTTQRPIEKAHNTAPPS